MHPVSLTRQAISATLHCLTGCAIGEVLGMIIGTALTLSNLATIILATTLAFVIGYTLTAWPLIRTGMALGAALTIALATDTISITVMEITDNLVVWLIPGALDAPLSDPLFWGALVVSLAAAFVAAVPVNRLLISRGLGHGHHH